MTRKLILGLGLCSWMVLLAVFGSYMMPPTDDTEIAMAGGVATPHAYHTNCAHATSDWSQWFYDWRQWASDTIQTPSENFYPHLAESRLPQIFQNHPNYIADGFDFPVGRPNALNYFKAREFGEKRHLGEDWNGLDGGNTDLGDPVYSAAHGVVTFAENVCCGWGNVIRVVHRVPNDPQNEYVESVYAHLHNVEVRVGDLVERGERIGTIGTANGRYSAHLHFELRDFIHMSLGPGYSDDTYGYLIPTSYINRYRPQ